MLQKACIVALFFMLISSLFYVVSGETIYVDDSGGKDYTKIQDAIDTSSDGDTVYVCSGSYYESITIDNQITLMGEDKINTIINSGDKGPALYVKNVQGVVISNLTITAGRKYLDTDDGSVSYMYDGIRLEAVTHSKIDNCIISNCAGHAIYYTFSGRNCHNITISNNLIQGNGFGIDTGSHSNDNFLVNNNITSNGGNGEQDTEPEGNNGDNDGDSGTPGFELLFVVCATALFLLWKRKR